MVVKKTQTLKLKQPRRKKSFVKLNDEMVSQYIIDNPDFFIRNATHIERMRVPHPVRGMISLPEWHMARQRNKISQLESEITLLMEHASANELLFNQLIKLQFQLIKAKDINELLDSLKIWAKDLGLSGAYLYLFDDKWLLSAPSNYHYLALNSSQFDFIRVRHLQYSQFYLGSLNTTELDFLLPKHGYVGSVALSLLGQFGDLGLLMFTSTDPQHYQTGQGTLLLEKISEILPILIEKWIMRKK
ncbi:DUF484 family protein [Gilliamella apicola]|jgi:Uncharacterized protein conserved in bacteria|uniref:DUF484 family protein n=1 Tax=Gilliamella apicola TaxID=1196095 RepID=A0A556RMY8_9GAMM|nr:MULTISPECIES: DUF484 family protein [Gilliamella]KES16628.1 hypothetical protein GASC598P17_013140 [Gilliamella apis SCGC AB-598-P17]MBI0061039.1 DUF484 family protein [Gilliamella sp. M0320]MBI0114638.1 DUF484 family protein [Gilliamella sp. W8123]MBI0118017.1 DUF484 family protein [Gilliamella sp. W8129]MBI0154477.1 DUF484 family protein [Gilliamella sp. W8128]